MSVSTYGYLFFLLITQYHHYLFCCPHCSRFGSLRIFFTWILYIFDMTPFCTFLYVLPYFLTLQNAPGLSFVFPALALELATFPGISDYFQGAGYIYCTWGVIYMYMYTNSYIHSLYHLSIWNEHEFILVSQSIWYSRVLSGLPQFVSF